MRYVVFLLSLTLFYNTTNGQDDPQLVQRAKAVLKYTRDKDLEKVMDYTYPKVFTIASREQLIEVMKGVYDSEEFSTTLDSLMIDTIFPEFRINNGRYVKIRHTMLMKMKFTEPFDTADAEENDTMVRLMEAEFGEGKVRFDKINNSININMLPELVAIKDDLSQEWTFITLDKDSPLVTMILKKEVIEKLKEFK